MFRLLGKDSRLSCRVLAGLLLIANMGLGSSCDFAQATSIGGQLGEQAEPAYHQPPPNSMMDALDVVVQPDEPREDVPRAVSQVATSTIADLIVPHAEVCSVLTAIAGNQWQPELPNNNVTNGSGSEANFGPNGWSKLPDLAYAGYVFNMSGYSGQPTLGIKWNSATRPSNPELLYIGFADVQPGLDGNVDNWDWFGGENAELLDGVLTLPGLEDYISDSGSMLVMIVVLGVDELRLEQLEIGVSEVRYLGDEYNTSMDEPSYAPPLDEGASPLPASYELSQTSFTQPVRNQLYVPSCTAFAIGEGAINYSLKEMYRESGWDLTKLNNQVSPKYLYWTTGDWGTNRVTQNVLEHLIVQGDATELNAPYNDSPANDFAAEADDDANLLKISKWEYVDCSTPARLTNLKIVLKIQNRPLVVRMQVDSSFGMYTGGVWNYTGAGGAYGHAMCIVGYDDTMQSEDGSNGAFKVRNSFGSSWGESGFVWVGYSTFLNSEAVVRCYTLSLSYNSQIVTRFCSGTDESIPQPQNVQATDGDFVNHVRISWTPVEGAQGYAIYRDSKQAPVETIGLDDHWDDTELPSEDFFSHTYWVKARVGGDLGPISAPDVGYKNQGLYVESIGPLTGRLNDEVQLSAVVTGQGTILYNWVIDPELGDIDSSTDTSPLITISGVPGLSYTIELTVDDDPDTNPPHTLQVQFSVLEPNSDPVAILSADPVAGEAPLLVEFDTLQSYDSDPEDNSALLFSIDYENDGIYDEENSTERVGYSHTYDSPGVYTAKLRVDDGKVQTFDYLTITADSAGSTLWKHSVGGQYTDAGLALSLAGSNIYVIGVTNSTEAGSAIPPRGLLIRYDSDGNRTMTQNYGWDAYESNLRDIVIDEGSSRIYVVGDRSPSGSGTDAWIMCLDYNGNIVWARNWGGSSLDFARACTLDPAGNLFVAVDTQSYGQDGDAAVLCIDGSDGSMIWHRLIGGANQEEGLDILCVGAQVYVCGITRYVDPNGDALVCSLNTSNGALIANKRWRTSDFDSFETVAWDGAHLSFGGQTFGPPADSGGDMLLATVPPDLSSIVRQSLIYTTTGESMSCLLVDNEGNYSFIGTGYVNGNDCLFGKLTATHNVLWARVISSGNSEIGRSLCFYSDGDLSVLSTGTDAGPSLQSTTMLSKAAAGTWLSAELNTQTDFNDVLSNITDIDIDGIPYFTNDTGGGSIDTVVHRFGN